RAGPAGARRLPRAGPRGARRPALAPGPRGRRDRARPPRRRDQRAAALAARRDRAVVRARLLRPPRGARPCGRDEGTGRGGPLARPRRRHARGSARAARGARAAPGRRAADARAAGADAPRRGVIELEPLRGLPEIRPGDDLAALLSACGAELLPPDVLVIAHKVVSKAEGRVV